MPKGDKEILKADPEDGTTPIANLLLEAIALAKLTGKEKGIMLYLCRRTYGWTKDGKRLKEAKLTLRDWAQIIQADSSKASHILSGLVEKNVLKREFLGPGKGYIYSINTRIAEWDKGCLNRQLLSNLGRQPLPKTTRHVLSKTTTPSGTKQARGNKYKEILKKDTTTGIEQSENLTQIVLCYEKNIGMITPMIAEDLKELSEKYSSEWFYEATKEACSNNARRLKYIMAILDRWAVEGFKSRKEKERSGAHRQSPTKLIPRTDYTKPEDY